MKLNEVLCDGTIIVTAPNGVKAARVIVLEEGSKTCGVFYPEGERARGEWRTTLYHISDDGEELYEHYCSECKKTVMISSLKKGRFNYCPNCGADMRGGNNA